MVGRWGVCRAGAPGGGPAAAATDEQPLLIRKKEKGPHQWGSHNVCVEEGALMGR